MDHGLQNMREFALTKMVSTMTIFVRATLVSTMTSLETKLIVCGTKEGRNAR